MNYVSKNTFKWWLFNGVARTFPTHKHMASEEEQEFENFSKYAVFLISSGKNLISPLLASRRKTFGKIH